MLPFVSTDLEPAPPPPPPPPLNPPNPHPPFLLPATPDNTSNTSSCRQRPETHPLPKKPQKWCFYGLNNATETAAPFLSNLGTASLEHRFMCRRLPFSCINNDFVWPLRFYWPIDKLTSGQFSPIIVLREFMGRACHFFRSIHCL